MNFRNNFQGIWVEIKKFFQVKAFENVVCKTAATLFSPNVLSDRDFGEDFYRTKLYNSPIYFSKIILIRWPVLGQANQKSERVK